MTGHDRFMSPFQFGLNVPTERQSKSGPNPARSYLDLERHRSADSSGSHCGFCRPPDSGDIGIFLSVSQ